VTPPPPPPVRTKPIGWLLPVLFLLALMWTAELADFVLPQQLDENGIVSRTTAGLPGILLAPFLHADFSHLIANTVPFLVLGSLVAWRARGDFWFVTLVIVVLGGLGVWLLGPGNVITIGASGIVFGFLAYLITAGILIRKWIDIAVGVIVLLVYGSQFWAALPFGVAPNVSWLAHLTGAIGGVAAALWLHKYKPAKQVQP
jgi:membrane associated rhomboid family serine protease